MRGQRSGAAPPSPSNSTRNGDFRGPIVVGAIAVAGSAALGAASRALARRTRRQRVLGVRVPRGLTPRNFAQNKLVDPKALASSIDLKQVIKQIGDAAEQIESRSEDVRILSSQAKRLSRKLS